jgi:hypothetical protein
MSQIPARSRGGSSTDTVHIELSNTEFRRDHGLKPYSLPGKSLEDALEHGECGGGASLFKVSLRHLPPLVIARGIKEFVPFLRESSDGVDGAGDQWSSAGDHPRARTAAIRCSRWGMGHGPGILGSNALATSRPPT